MQGHPLCPQTWLIFFHWHFGHELYASPVLRCRQPRVFAALELVPMLISLLFCATA